jgi:hypothetical protein
MCVSSTLVVLSVALTGDAPPRVAAVHAPRRGNPKVVVDHVGNRIRVDRPEGTVWLRQITDCPPDPYPGCLECHCDIENSTINMAGMELDCTFCHGGDPLANTKEEAHVQSNGQVTYDKTVPPIDEDLDYQRFVNPSNLRSLDQTCGFCHLWEALEIRESMMATAAGHYAGGLYQNNVVDTKTPIYGTFAVADTDGTVPTEQGAVESLLDLLIYSGGDPQQVATHFAAVPSQGCARCHLWSRGKGYQGAVGADGTYRADGCAACHVLYANDGLSQTADASIDHEEPGHPINHVITKQVPTEQCVHCHHRGARIGLSFTGRAQMPPRLPSGPGVPGTTDVVFNGNYHYTVPDTNPQDAHGAAGLQCIDCHTRLELMGDGNIYGHMDQATKIECRACHGLPGEFPTLLDNDGVPLPNVESDGENVVLTSKVTHRAHCHERGGHQCLRRLRDERHAPQAGRRPRVLRLPLRVDPQLLRLPLRARRAADGPEPHDGRTRGRQGHHEQQDLRDHAALCAGTQQRGARGALHRRLPAHRRRHGRQRRQDARLRHARDHQRAVGAGAQPGQPAHRPRGR